MQSFYDTFNLLTTFQMSFIYHQVTILVYKILIKYICITNTPYGIKIYNIVTKYIDNHNIHLSRGSEGQCNNTKLLM